MNSNLGAGLTFADGEERLRVYLLGSVARFRRRIRFAKTVHALPWSVGLVPLGLLAGQVLGAATGSPSIERGLALAGFVAAAIVVAARLARAPSPASAALEVDRRLGLKERLSTAIEVLAKPPQSRLAPFQLADAARHAAVVRTDEAHPLRPSATGLIFTAVAGLLFAIWSFLPADSGPRALLAGVAAAATEANAAGEGQALLPSEAGALEAGLIDPMAAANVERLRQALEQLQNAANREAIAKGESLGQIGDALRRSPTSRDLARNLTAGDFEAAAEELKNLGERLSKMNETERAELAKDMATAAELTKDFPELSGKFQEAADALNEFRNRSAAQALSELAGQIQEAGAAMATEEALQGRISAMEKALREAEATAGLPGPETGEAGAPGEESGGTGDSPSGDGQGLGLRSSAHGTEVAAEAGDGVETRLDAAGNVEIVNVNPNAQAPTEKFERPVLQLGSDIDTSLDPSAGDLGFVRSRPDTPALVPLDVAPFVSGYFSPPEVK